MHKSKGLDFDHVYIPQLHKTLGRTPPPAGIGNKTRASEVEVGWELELFGARSLGWSSVLSAQEQVDHRERIRLLYVAMTRARNRLVLLGNWFGISWKADQAVEVGSLLALLEWRSGGHPVEPEQMKALGEELDKLISLVNL